MGIEEKRDELIGILNRNNNHSNCDIYLWGTGNTAVLYQEGLRRLEKEGLLVKGYIDNDNRKWGTKFYGKEVYSPDSLCTAENALILLVSPQPTVIRAVSEQIEKMGLKWEHIDEYIFGMNADHVMEVFDLFEDDYSRRLYLHLIKRRIKGKNPSPKYVNGELYFSFPFFRGNGIREVFVDCGAYVGDTLERFIWSRDGSFGKIFAIEPDDGNVKAMECRIRRLQGEWGLKDEQICILPYAVSDQNSVGYIDKYEKSNGLSSKLTSEKTFDRSEISKISIMSIDECISEPFDLLKADVESYEYRMLIGAEKSIKKYKPKLAISIYHNAVDFYSIPLLLHDMVNEYKFSIRHYSNKLEDTVLYAY